MSPSYRRKKAICARICSFSSCESLPGSSSKPNVPDMKEALSFIEQNYQNDVSVEQIADFCGLNRSYFGKIFRSTMGEAPQRFLMYYRMARAAQFLKESTLSVGAIGAMVGYANQLHFSRAFKAVYGVCPREYRQNHFIRPLRSPADQLRSRPSSENAEGACREDIQGYKD